MTDKVEFAEAFSACTTCKRKLYMATNIDFEQYSLNRILPVECYLCGQETTNWFTDYGIIMLKRAIGKAQIDGNL